MSTQSSRLQYPDFIRIAPKAAAALNALGEANHAALDASLIELLEVRASQINGCAFCVQYHLALARKANVATAKLDLLATWHEAGEVYTPAERAALAWTEHLTNVSHQGAPDAIWAALQEHFTQDQVVAICSVVATINAWNRIAISLAFAPSV